ncbi:hypothetical protein QJS04_geneDACA015337 [Acorus gramineus]|uniref:N-acetyltransferase domain-containing protein n=1 Tax=Acorus gramineus TaxID=55184 RepID=A0AAV9AQB2_ACOGR|nr:hypothetical protein QJS04_geneDACA015337 [Acorus gramineus]
MRTCLVAITGGSNDGCLFLGSEGFKNGDFDGMFSFRMGSIAGILTVDTLADFLPRKGPLRQRSVPRVLRTGIAYISNVAVRKEDRKKGIAKRLVTKAEAQAQSWGCRAIALHCEADNMAATRLYQGRGFRLIKVPEQANWPHPKASPGTQFQFMMKLLNTSNIAKH